MLQAPALLNRCHSGIKDKLKTSFRASEQTDSVLRRRATIDLHNLTPEASKKAGKRNQPSYAGRFRDLDRSLATSTVLVPDIEIGDIGDTVVIEVTPCPIRSLLRTYWPAKSQSPPHRRCSLRWHHHPEQIGCVDVEHELHLVRTQQTKINLFVCPVVVRRHQSNLVAFAEQERILRCQQRCVLPVIGPIEQVASVTDPLRLRYGIRPYARGNGTIAG